MSDVTEAAARLLTRIERENAINCTGLGEVGCNGRQDWHSWSEHRLHVAAAQVAALADAGLLTAPANAPHQNPPSDTKENASE